MHLPTDKGIKLKTQSDPDRHQQYGQMQQGNV